MSLNYTPIPEKNNHNVSKENPWFLVLRYLGFILLLIVSAYLLFFLLSQFVISKVSLEEESRFFANYDISEFGSVNPKQTEYVQQILDTLDLENMERFDYQVKVLCNDEFNAITLPGAEIYVFSGLLNELNSEDELAFVLAHEVAHIKNRDALKKVVTHFPIKILISLFSDSGTFEQVNIFVENQYGKRTEITADSEALFLLNQKYGHIAGATNFLEDLLEKDLDFLNLFSDHPMVKKRLKNVKKLMLKNNFDELETISLNYEFVFGCF